MYPCINMCLYQLLPVVSKFKGRYAVAQAVSKSVSYVIDCSAVIFLLKSSGWLNDPFGIQLCLTQSRSLFYQAWLKIQVWDITSQQDTFHQTAFDILSASTHREHCLCVAVPRLPLPCSLILDLKAAHITQTHFTLARSGLGSS